MLKSLRLCVALVAVLATPISTTFIASPASASPQNIAVSSRSIDKRFIEEYNMLAMMIPEGYKNVVETPTEISNTIRLAKNLCKVLKSGMPVEQIYQWPENLILKRLQEDGLLEDYLAKKFLTNDIGIVNIIAPKHYCPTFTMDR